MYGWIRNLIGVAEDVPNLRLELEALEEEAAAVYGQERAHVLNRAGDRCVAAEEHELATVFFGRAVDLYITTGHLELATALCRKIVRVSPGVARAHCTLSFLALVEGDVSRIERDLDAYVRATRQTRTERFAIPRLRLMAEGCGQAEILELLGRALQDLGALEMGHALFEQAHERKRARASSTPRPDEERRAWLLQAAMLAPHELWERYWLNLDDWRGWSSVRAGAVKAELAPHIPPRAAEQELLDHLLPGSQEASPGTAAPPGARL